MPPFPEPYSDAVPILIFAVGGLIAIFHGLNPARSMDKFTLPATGLVFLGIAATVRSFAVGSGFENDPDGAVLVLRQARDFFCSCSSGSAAPLPRFRYDQLMRFAWIFLFPLSMLNLLITGLVVALSSK